MSLTTIRAGIKTVLEAQIVGLRVYDFVPDKPEPPCVIIAPPFPGDFADFDVTFGGGVQWTLAVKVLVSRATDRSAQEALDPYLGAAGASSIRAALRTDRTLDGSCDTSRIVGARGYGSYVFGDVAYLGAELVVDIIESE